MSYLKVTTLKGQINPRPGFAALSPEERKIIARKGGKAAWNDGTAHRFTPEEARAAALKSVEKRKNNPRPPKPPKPKSSVPKELLNWMPRKYDVQMTLGNSQLELQVTEDQYLFLREIATQWNGNKNTPTMKVKIR